MKKIKLTSLCFLWASIFGIISCTDSTTENPEADQGDTLFANIQQSLFTGVYDTINYSLLVNTISKAEYEKLQSSLPNGDSLTKAICGDKEGGCMEAMEQYYISKFPDKAKRENKNLILTLSNGKSMTLTNNESEDDGYEVYQFQRLDKNGYYVVAVFYYESFGYYLINATTGKKTFTISTPVLSPGQGQYAAANYDMVAAFTYNGLELLTVDKDSAASIMKIDFITWGPEEVKWKDERTLYVKQKSQPEDGPEQNSYAAIRIIRRGDS